jgi:hypothetical protein
VLVVVVVVRMGSSGEVRFSAVVNCVDAYVSSP